MNMKNFFRDLKGSFGSPAKGFWVFVAIVLIGIVLIGGMMCRKKKGPPPAPQRSALEISLIAENKRLQSELFETQKKLATALGKQEVLKDSIEMLHTKIRTHVSAPPVKTGAKTVAETAMRTKSTRVVRTTAPCDCPTAFGYYRNRGTNAALTKKYCKIHGTRK